MKYWTWSPPSAVRSALNENASIGAEPLKISNLGTIHVVSEGVLRREEFTLIAFKGARFVVPTRTLEFK